MENKRSKPRYETQVFYKFALESYYIAGQERYRAVTSRHYRNALGALIVYDITNRKSFDHLERWIEELKDNASKYVRIILVGNKVDLVENTLEKRKI